MILRVTLETELYGRHTRRAFPLHGRSIANYKSFSLMAARKSTEESPPDTGGTCPTSIHWVSFDSLFIVELIGWGI